MCMERNGVCECVHYGSNEEESLLTTGWIDLLIELLNCLLCSNMPLEPLAAAHNDNVAKVGGERGAIGGFGKLVTPQSLSVKDMLPLL